MKGVTRLSNYEPTIQAPKAPPTEDQLLFRGFVTAVTGIVLIAAIIAGCTVANNTDEEQIKVCNEQGGTWTWEEDEDGEKLTNSGKTCVIPTPEE